MNGIFERRRFLQAGGAFLASSISGCLGDDDEPGQLFVRNDHSLGHTITFRIEDGPTTAPEVENETAAEIFVDESEERRYDGVFSNTGQYTFVARLDAGDQETSTTFEPLGVESGHDGEQLLITVLEDYRLTHTISRV